MNTLSIIDISFRMCECHPAKPRKFSSCWIWLNIVAVYTGIVIANFTGPFAQKSGMIFFCIALALVFFSDRSLQNWKRTKSPATFRLPQKSGSL